MLLVVGATGLLGGTIAHGLLEAGRPVRVLVRPPSDHLGLVSAGAEPVFGDLKDRPSLDRACRGIDTIITTATAASRGGADTIESVDLKGNRALIEAARDAGVHQFIFVSANGASPTSPIPLIAAKGQTEATLKRSGMTWTILAPEAFMEIWLGGYVVASALEGREIVYVGSGAARRSFVSYRDVAAYALAAVDQPAARDRYLPIGGPAAFSFRDAIAMTERFLGHPVAHRSVAPGEAVAGVPDVVLGLLAMLDAGESIVDMTEPSRTFGVEPTPFPEVLEGMAPVPVGA